MKHEIDITKFNIMAFASNVLSFQNGFVTVTDENLGNLYFGPAIQIGCPDPASRPQK